MGLRAGVVIGFSCLGVGAASGDCGGEMGAHDGEVDTGTAVDLDLGFQVGDLIVQVHSVLGVPGSAADGDSPGAVGQLSRGNFGHVLSPVRACFVRHLQIS